MMRCDVVVVDVVLVFRQAAGYVLVHTLGYRALSRARRITGVRVAPRCSGLRLRGW